MTPVVAPVVAASGDTFPFPLMIINPNDIRSEADLRATITDNSWVWTEKKEGQVRIETCGDNLCGYAIDDNNAKLITDDMKAAMRAKDAARLSTIRMLLAAVKHPPSAHDLPAPTVGRSIREGRFRNRYNAAVLAHWPGEPPRVVELDGPWPRGDSDSLRLLDQKARSKPRLLKVKYRSI